MVELRGNHRGIIGEIGETPRQPSHQHPQQAILGDGLRSAVQNLPHEANVKAQVGSRIHIVRLTMRHHLFLEFWLVGTWFFAHWRHHRAVSRLENVCQSSIRRGKKLGFQLSQNTLYDLKRSRGPKKGQIFSSKWTGYTWINWFIFRVTEPYLEPSLKINKRLRLKIANDPKIE